jgi:hypothetical protein
VAIYRLIAAGTFDPEAIKVMTIAYEPRFPNYT